MVPHPQRVTRDVVVVGASVGGVEALPRLVSLLPAGLPASVVIVQHRAPAASETFVSIIQRRAHLPVALADQGGRHERGHVYVAPADVHLTFSDGHFNLTCGARENHSRPSINRLFRSAAAHYGSRAIGVILTGLLDDGVAGLVAIARVGGETFVQDPASAVAPELPRNALAAVPTSRALPIEGIAEALVRATVATAPSIPVPEAIELESRADLGPSRTAETAMWNAVRALNERGVTLESLAQDASARGDLTSASEFDQRARATFAQARLAYDFMKSMTTAGR